jgi:hydroxypyruvate isomerase
MKTPLRPNKAARASRRRFLRRAGGAAVAAAAVLPRLAAAPEDAGFYRVKNNRIRQSVVHWCFNPMSVAELAGHAARMGCQSVELVGPEHWPTLRQHGLICAISGSHGFARGFAHVEEHDECIARLQKSIDATADAGWPGVITFSGFRRGLSDAAGMKNMVDGLKKIVGHAEKKKVTLCLEMLNSRVDVTMKGHPDYFCDDIERTVEICKRVGSERLKVLFDIYHVQIMHGDVITRIKQHHAWIGHYHTAGVPGRGEIDDTQELNYAPIMRAIVETGYQGYVGQEFIPTRDKVASLNQGVRLCDV